MMRLRRITLFAITVLSCLLPRDSSGYSPDIVNHRAIAGLWKLKHRSSSSSSSSSSSLDYPIKEFTVYPKTTILPQPKINSQNNDNNDKDILLMLKEDGSFQQYSTEETIPDSLRFFQKRKKGDTKNDEDDDDAILDRYFEFGKLNGNWNLIEGKLILAADRPTDAISDRSSSSSSSSSLPARDTTKNDDTEYDVTDTILEGKVVATSEEGLVDNPTLLIEKDDGGVRKQNNDPKVENANTTGNNKASRSRTTATPGSTISSSSSGIILDTHLSVPKGRVKIGRFFYPKNHPSFFDVPIFNPQQGGKFELEQVLGSLNTKQERDDEIIEKFHESDFHNKTFILTSQPLPQFKPKGRQHWSIKYNKFVEDPPKLSSKTNANDEEKSLDKPIHNIRVVEMKFFQNNTFATIGGLGGATILRGKYSVIGNDKDHLWMQIMRFGFGRSVSGSVFSEGRSLAKDDEKAYWGRIRYDTDADTDTDGEDDENGRRTTEDGTTPSKDAVMRNKEHDDDTIDDDDDDRHRLVVKGSVLLGYGLEPLPVGLFVLAETMASSSSSSSPSSLDSSLDDVDHHDFDDDDDDDDDDEDFCIDGIPNFNLDDDDDDDDDDFFDLANAFQ